MTISYTIKKFNAQATLANLAGYTLDMNYEFSLDQNGSSEVNPTS